MRKVVMPGRRERRRQDRVSHWPPRQSARTRELLDGRSVRQLSRAQRERIAALIEQWDVDAPEVRETVRAILAEDLEAVPPPPRPSPLFEAAWALAELQIASDTGCNE